MRFRTTANIFKDHGEYFDPNWMDSNKVVLPPKTDWDYSRDMRLEDVDIWEVLWEAGGSWGVYASWSPYAEFYMVRTGFDREIQGLSPEFYYGTGAQNKVIKRMKELNMPTLNLNTVWVEPEDMWLYS